MVGLMVVSVEIETWVIWKGGVKVGVGEWWKRCGDVEFWGPVCVWVSFHCCSGGWLCQGFQKVGVCKVGTVG
jgi:hypothetical protein